MVKCYDILDRDHRPFCVEVGDRQISVWNQRYIQAREDEDDNEGHWELGRLLIFGTTHQVWIGDNYEKLDQKDEYYPCHRYPGNTILFYRELVKRYVFIGPSIYAFSPVDGDVIHAYYSPIRRSDHECVPYAIGEKYVYFPMDLTYLPREQFKDLGSRKDALSLGDVELIHPRV